MKPLLLLLFSLSVGVGQTYREPVKIEIASISENYMFARVVSDGDTSKYFNVTQSELREYVELLASLNGVKGKTAVELYVRQRMAGERKRRLFSY